MQSSNPSLRFVTRPIYGNIGVLHPEGFLMFYGNDDKAEWYLSRNLAVWVSKDPPTIQLTFTPNGNGHKGDNFYLQHRVNVCVVCGAKEDLTRHHVIPHSIRKFFPDRFKNYSSYDILPMCWECHHAYERKADDFKKSLADKHNIKYSGYFSVNHYERLDKIRFQSLLWNSEWNMGIPEQRRAEMKKEVEAFLTSKGMTENELKSFPRRKGHPHHRNEDAFGSKLVQHLKTPEDFQQFIILWRKHFIESMNPQHMPQNWCVDRIEKNHHD